jgi:phosphoglycolate phosphatase-like HAD superfamily hydrolase
MNCRVAEGLDELRAATHRARWLIVSGGDQGELRDIFSTRGLSSLFDGGIMGSPDTKDFILKREIELGNIVFPALFLGDSRYDYEVAISSGLDFIFVSGWTEFREWQELVEKNSLLHVKWLSELCRAIGE